jgi:hypothetical protein
VDALAASTAGREHTPAQFASKKKSAPSGALFGVYELALARPACAAVVARRGQTLTRDSR